MTHGNEKVSAIEGPTEAERSLIAGFAAGARRARPHISVLVYHAGTSFSQAPCEAAANRQINRGSAVIFDAAGDCGFAALQAAVFRGVWGVAAESEFPWLGGQGTRIRRTKRCRHPACRDALCVRAAATRAGPPARPCVRRHRPCPEQPPRAEDRSVESRGSLRAAARQRRSTQLAITSRAGTKLVMTSGMSAEFAALSLLRRCRCAHCLHLALHYVAPRCLVWAGAGLIERRGR
jgi:hypothetical protein